jgi:hypothetical protein
VTKLCLSKDLEPFKQVNLLLIQLLRESLKPGVQEASCRPGDGTGCTPDTRLPGVLDLSFRFCLLRRCW